MFNISVFDDGRIAAFTDESQLTIIVQDKASKKVIRLVEGDEVSTFQRHTRIAAIIDQIKQEADNQKAQLSAQVDAQAQSQINTVNSEFNAYFNGFAVWHAH